MIGQLRGLVISQKPPTIILDVQGVGYEVQSPMSTCYHLKEQQETTLLTHLIVREDAQQLFGFLTDAERELFRALIKVNGVGPKLAITILSGLEPHQFVQAINQNNTTVLVNIPGIGKKTAERLIVETRDRLKQLSLDTTNTASTQATHPPISNDALSALTALGYKPHEAKRAVEHCQAHDHTTESLIKQALQYLMTGVTS